MHKHEKERLQKKNDSLKVNLVLNLNNHRVSTNLR